MARKKTPGWSKNVEESGITVRLYERGGVIYREVRGVGGRADGKDRQSLRHGDRKLAVDQATALAREIARLRLTGQTTGPLTLGELLRLYKQERAPLLSPARKRFMETTADLLVQHFGERFNLADFSQHHADAYVAARQSGQVHSDDRRAADAPQAGTIRNELAAFKTICRWGMGFRRSGRALLGTDPLHGIQLPREENVARPVASEQRYRKLLAVADTAEPSGRLWLLLVLGWETGRRINAILHLRRSDLLLTPEELRRALAEEGQDERLAEQWPAAIRWRAEHDKCGYLSFAPLNRAAREAVQAYLAKNPKIGDAWVFPGNRRPEEALDKLMAGYYLSRAEEAAALPKLRRGGWHAFRRAWATKRRHLPARDVAEAGGWRSLEALQTAYQHADAQTVRAVVEVDEGQQIAPGGPILDTPAGANADSA